MAFHVACPITCRSICFCTLGFSQKLQSEKGRKGFLEEVFRVEGFLSDPFFTKANESISSTVQVAVPHIEAPPPLPPPPPPPPPPPLPPPIIASVDGFGGGVGDGYDVVGGREDVEELLSVQSNKQVAMQKKALVASLAAEDYARRFETRSLHLQDVAGATIQDLVGENQSSSTAKIMCRICFHGENERSEKGIRMPSCKLCHKKYHRSCLKKWARHRDLFHWSSWVCPSCRSCEICRRTGDPTKFMFCKRCDGAFHCYCQHPPHKNVSHGPYLCPKHTRCHSCGSTVSGSGLSTRWFLGYTCCDACGRLFVKGKYCPVCLKVYRDSESTPMVCCDVCQRWVHCQCDGISDEKYMQFQVDRNLYYKCAACRGECYQVKNLDDSIQELWRRRDIADRDQIAILRAAAGLPIQEEIFSMSPFSDEENDPIVLKNDYGRSFKISVKGSADKPTKKTKEYVKKKNKKYDKKKGHQVPSICETEGHQSHDLQHDPRSFEFNLGDEMKDDMLSYNSEHHDPFTSLGVRTPGNTKEKCSINQAGFMKHNFVEEAVVNTEDTAPRIVQFKRSKSHGLYHENGARKHASKSENVKGKKLVIHLGARNRNATNSPRSEASGHHREQNLAASNGEKLDNANELKDSKHRGMEGNLIKLGNVKLVVSELNPNFYKGNTIEGYASTAVRATRVSSGRNEGSTNAIETVIEEAPALISEEAPLRRHSKGTPSVFNEIQDNDIDTTSGSDALPKDPKPLLKLKFKTPYVNNQSSWAPQSEDERSFVKGQRSKRKKPSIPIREGQELTQMHQDNQVNEFVDANWILRKLGKDAIGKRVEVHQPSDSSWHKGVITDAVEGTSTLAVDLDDGRAQTLKLGEQGVRFIPQKQKRSKTLNMI